MPEDRAMGRWNRESQQWETRTQSMSGYKPLIGRQGKRPDDRWETLMVRLTADNPTWPYRRIWRELSIENQKLPLDYRISGDPPSRKTVTKRAKQLREPENKATLDARKSVYFPETFELGHPDLPWESLPHVMELLRRYPELYNPDGSVRPTITLAKWFYRLSLSAPSSPIVERTRMARMMAMKEVEPSDKPSTWMHRYVELWLMHEPWKKPEDFHHYDPTNQTTPPWVIRQDLFDEAVKAMLVTEDDYAQGQRHALDVSDAELREMGRTREDYNEWLKRYTATGKVYDDDKLF